MTAQLRRVRFNKAKPTKPWRATLGSYSTRDEAPAACSAVRKVVPKLPAGRPKMQAEKRQTILDTYHATGSQKATAAACGVGTKTVQRSLNEAR